jgi:hypothetical protein
MRQASGKKDKMVIFSMTPDRHKLPFIMEHGRISTRKMGLRSISGY